MLSLVRTMLASAAAQIEPRSRVNRLHDITGPERIDGLVINVHRGLAYVAWPDGETTTESVRHLVPIVA